MAYQIVPPKGEPTFCENECNHKDCAMWRNFFASKCDICGKPFEEGQYFYDVKPGVWIHSKCLHHKL